jgi:protein SCO1
MSGIVLALTLASSAAAQMMGGGIMRNTVPPSSQTLATLKTVTVDQRLNEQVPADLTFRDESGRAVRLGDYYGHKPIILNLQYFQCQMLCGEVTNGLVASLKTLKFDVNKEFEVLSVSFDPRETVEMAADKKKSTLQRYHRDGAEAGWHFLTGDQKNVEALTKSVGFSYQFDSTSGQWAHAAAIMLLTPEGKISRYFYGVEFAPKDLRLGLIEASQNKIGTVVDQVLLYCYHYNPATGKYGAVIMNVMRLAGGVTVLILGTFMFIMFRREPAQKPGAARIA